MADEGSVGTFEYPINGRTMVFKKVHKAQIIMLERHIQSLQRRSKIAQDAEDIDTLLALAKKMSDATWTMVESLFTDPEDLDWVQVEIIAERLNEEDLLPLLSDGRKIVTPEDDADPAPAAKRPGRKAPAKKAARKAAPVHRGAK